MSNDIFNLENINPVEIFKSGGCDELITTVKNAVHEFVPDISTAKGRKDIASISLKIAKSKTYLDEIGKEYVSGIKEIAKVIDNERKKMRDELDALKATVRLPLTEWEDEEKARNNNILRRINEISAKSEFDDLSEIDAAINEIELIVVDDSFAEHVGYAEKVIKDVLTILKAKLIVKTEEKQQADEQQRIEVERIEKQRIDREEKIAAEAAQRAKFEVEQKVKAEAEAKEAEAKKREANNNHRDKINNQAFIDLVNNVFELDEAHAKSIIDAIAKGQISNVKITY